MRNAVNTLDELAPQDYAKAEVAIKLFRKGKQNRADEHILYDSLTNAGLTSEGADEFVGMEANEASAAANGW